MSTDTEPRIQGPTRRPAIGCLLIAFNLLTMVGVGVGLALLIQWGLSTSSPADTLPACATEDSNNCYWNAADHGNGVGQSFYTIDGTTHYSDGSTVHYGN